MLCIKKNKNFIQVFPGRSVHTQDIFDFGIPDWTELLARTGTEIPAPNITSSGCNSKDIKHNLRQLIKYDSSQRQADA